MADIEIVRAINALHGHGVLAVWDLGKLDEATIDALLTIRTELAAVAKDAAEIEAVKQRIRNDTRR
ncbi:MAG TPA: hypothetical protein PL117_03225 [Accumulibacter sp.]|uniref:hypothetical protein n=1 Tax=Accumulibacter sp. TaxID=2053492 RepID=UPI002D0C371C|nr:hypothetical protein [Accumulibacter sp.]HRF71759.1 hypothetical protein [Accumulibacter sp.]